jgi:hypothetical protein
MRTKKARGFFRLLKRRSCFFFAHPILVHALRHGVSLWRKSKPRHAVTSWAFKSSKIDMAGTYPNFEWVRSVTGRVETGLRNFQ